MGLVEGGGQFTPTSAYPSGKFYFACAPCILGSKLQVIFALLFSLPLPFSEIISHVYQDHCECNNERV